MTQAITELELQLSTQKQQHDDLQQEQEDLLVCLAESDMTIRDLKKRLLDLGQEVEMDEEDEEDQS